MIKLSLLCNANNTHSIVLCNAWNFFSPNVQNTNTWTFNCFFITDWHFNKELRPLPKRHFPRSLFKRAIQSMIPKQNNWFYLRLCRQNEFINSHFSTQFWVHTEYDPNTFRNAWQLAINKRQHFQTDRINTCTVVQMRSNSIECSMFMCVKYLTWKFWTLRKKMCTVFDCRNWKPLYVV